MFSHGREYVGDTVNFRSTTKSFKKKSYEDNANGKIDDERYAILTDSLETEQKELKAAVPEMEAELERQEDKSEGIRHFVEKVKRITELNTLTPELVHEFIEKIMVYEPRYVKGK